jgi:hypothetical protein
MPATPTKALPADLTASRRVMRGTQLREFMSEEYHNRSRG